MHPKQLAIIKCQAHKKGKDFVIKGNNAADQYAKQASGCTTAIMAPSDLIQPQPQLADIERIQQQATPCEISVWQHRGATQDANGLWRSHEGHMIAPTPLLTILISDAYGFDHCARREVILKEN